MAEHACEAEPIVTQFGRRLTYSPPLTLEKGGKIKYHLPFQPIVDRPGELMSQDRQRFPLTVFVLSAGQRLVARRIVPQEEDGRFRKGPFEIRIADLRAGSAIPLPRRFLGAFNHAARGHKILDPREAGAIMDLVEQYQTQNLANAGDGLESVQGLSVVLLGRLHDGQFDIAE
jgi:hypothetical protein